MQEKVFPAVLVSGLFLAGHVVVSHRLAAMAGGGDRRSSGLGLQVRRMCSGREDQRIMDRVFWMISGRGGRWTRYSWIFGEDWALSREGFAGAPSSGSCLTTYLRRMAYPLPIHLTCRCRDRAMAPSAISTVHDDLWSAPT